ncbi:hypothetical protein [Flavobacterium sp. NKUCC04_CG]|uniref:hypothetical protein n=1 Tax=Flavobacterium sp. NKUCC04_CG TaxID=2842121 RepID=UPI001C5B9E3E|nr:hypothetical protein [Flavobacterium sp. NKUCC04_CG]MBW3519855.1 hypothetical protein [Flavobacterium sp. NKUCC04_CG]
MAVNVFKPSNIKNLYVLQGAVGWVAYILPPDYKEFPQSISLDDSLNIYRGNYLFAASPPDLEQPHFISNYWTFLNTKYPTNTDRCFFWFNPEYGKEDIELGKALLFKKLKYWSTSGNVNPGYSSQHLDLNDSIFMGIPPSCKIEIVGSQFVISRMPTSVTKDTEYGLFLSNKMQNKSIRIGKIDTKGVGKEQPLLIPLTGINRGCLKFAISFPFTFEKPLFFECENDLYPYVKSKDVLEEYTILDTGFKYFYTDKEQRDTELVYDVFQQTIPASFTASIDFSDVFNEWNPRRTHFAFREKNNTKIKEQSLLPTKLITNYGKQIVFQPITQFDTEGSPTADSALIVFGKGILSPTAQQRYCWTLEGDFTLGTADQESESDFGTMLLCGLSGTETISFTEASKAELGDRISFFPDKPAYAACFDTDKKVPIQSQNTLLLTDKYTTSWALIKKGPNSSKLLNNYYSQPVQAPLYEPGKNRGTLDYAEVPSANLAALDCNNKDGFPLVPSATVQPIKKLRKKGDIVQDNSAVFKLFEIEVLNPSRKQIIAHFQKVHLNAVKKRKKTSTVKRITADDCPLGNLTTTPQGFLVNLNSDKTAWKCLTLANNERSGSETTQLPLRFKGIDIQNNITGLQSAFQTNEQFLVISDPTKPDNPEVLQYYIDHFQNQINIADWPFLLDIAHQNKQNNTDAEFTNIMIFKFCNKSIEERIKDSELWTDATVFNQEKQIPNLIKWIEAYIETARKAISNTETDSNSPQNRGFKQFINIVTNPLWQGVLVLQVTLNPDHLPAEIKAIMAGINPAGFAAHHFGIEANQIKTTDKQQLDVNFKSSLFGMISYFNPMYLAYQNETIPRPESYPQAPGDYDFQVLDLQILFANSLVADFRASIQLSLNSLFDEMVVRETAVSKSAIYSNSIVMNGQYDKKNGNISYTFTVAQPNTLWVSSTAIESVTITGIELSTVEDMAPKQEIKKDSEKNLMTTRFNLSGNLKFKEIGDFDLFSYDSLSFDNLLLDMKFSLKDINPRDRTPHKTFLFIPANINFNKSSSKARLGSLVQHFPIELKNLMYNNPDKAEEQHKITNPESLGFIRVEAPLPTAPVSDYWYALRFNLNLGSLGALAAKVGFDATLILAWRPGIASNQTHIYVKMPFSGGGGGFSIEGVLKFEIGSVLFFNEPKTRQYAMIFTQVGVSLLGKKLPPNGSTVLYLFGNPDSPAASGSASSNLAWFGAYKQDKKQELSKPKPKKKKSY